MQYSAEDSQVCKKFLEENSEHLDQSKEEGKLSHGIQFLEGRWHCFCKQVGEVKIILAETIKLLSQRKIWRNCSHSKLFLKDLMQEHSINARGREFMTFVITKCIVIYWNRLLFHQGRLQIHQQILATSTGWIRCIRAG